MWHSAAVPNCSNDNCTLHVCFCLKFGASLIPDTLLSSPKCCAGFASLLCTVLLLAAVLRGLRLLRILALPAHAPEQMCFAQGHPCPAGWGAKGPASCPRQRGTVCACTCTNSTFFPGKKVQILGQQAGSFGLGDRIVTCPKGGSFIPASSCPEVCHCMLRWGTATALLGVTLGGKGCKTPGSASRGTNE